MFVKQFKCLDCNSRFDHVVTDNLKIICLNCSSLNCEEVSDSFVLNFEKDCANCSKCSTCDSSCTNTK